MRILRIRFKNLNSLTGEWSIDLTHPAFAANGLFVITGPTGAGKTTILDAVCLALYGRTPRLGRISKSGNEILSRQTGECFAEVEFATQAGRFRCNWSQRRARGRADGELQAPKHELCNVENGQPLNKLRDVAAQIEVVTGMDFERFTRSMLLAQGGFTAFLQAAPDERAPILEQITGTRLYSDISIRVHERRRAEQDRLTQLKAETAGIALLDAEAERALQQAVTDGQQAEAAMQAKVEATAGAIAWLQTLAGLKRELDGLDGAAVVLEAELAAFAPARERLQLAERAAALDGPYATLAALRARQQRELAELRRAEADLPGLEQAAQALHSAQQLAERTHLEARTAQDAAAPLLRRVRELDQTLAAQEKTLAAETVRQQEATRALAGNAQARRAVQNRERAARAALADLERYLAAHAPEAGLVSGLTGIEARLAALLAAREDRARALRAQRQAAAALDEAAARLKALEQRQGDAAQALSLAEARLRAGEETLRRTLDGRLLREYRADKEHLLHEQVLEARIARLEALRATLAAGQPCPLCGATTHPYAEGQLPVPGDLEQRIRALGARIEAAETQEAANRTLEAVLDTARAQQNEARQLAALAARDKDAAQAALAETGARQDSLQTTVKARAADLLEPLRPLGLDALPDDLSALPTRLRARLDNWQAHLAGKAAQEKQLQELAAEAVSLEAVAETRHTALRELDARLANLYAEHAAARAERGGLYGDKSPEDGEAALRAAVTQAETAEKDARAQALAHQQRAGIARSALAALQASLRGQEAPLRRAEADFAASRAGLGFADEGAFSAARLSVAERDALAGQAKTLDARQARLAADRQARAERLAAERARQLTDRPLAELALQQQADQAGLDRIRNELAEQRVLLLNNNRAKRQVADRQTQIADQQRECLRWDQLHELIGSADGKKYRNFAQGLTFELMVGYANRQLQRMTDRYLLLRNRVQPLDLDVIDNYQAGEVRSTKNLSGGESFMVSLALALGLSRMSSRKVRVDSLFLDEGFGTLDDETLETALETLAGLQQDGKLIGVISHVAALKERIRTQLLVTPDNNGHSRLSGPGCTGPAPKED